MCPAVGLTKLVTKLFVGSRFALLFLAVIVARCFSYFIIIIITINIIIIIMNSFLIKSSHIKTIISQWVCIQRTRRRNPGKQNIYIIFFFWELIPFFVLCVAERTGEAYEWLVCVIGMEIH